ncbi:MAG: hypothetical protein JJ855_14745 [Rhodospirillales bacterium]|nr:hypothetical protein [Rhodospirillales bacterium]
MIALRKEAEPSMNDVSRPFLGFAADDATADIVRAAVEARDLSGDNVIVSDLTDAMNGLAAIRTPPLLIVDLGDATDIMAAAGQLSTVCDAGAQVILIGTVNDLRVYRDIISAGVADYLVKPFTEDDLIASIDRARPQKAAPAERAADPLKAKSAELTAVIGVRGGVGASTIAANAAWHAAEKLMKKVTLIDMDLTFGTQALILDVDPGGGLSDAMKEPGRMDELFIKRASVGVGERLRVMASETDPGQGDLASSAAFSGLLEFVRADSDLVVVDLPRTLAVAQPKFLEACERIVLVAEPGLGAMRDTARLANHISKHNPAAQVSVVLNRQGVGGKDELTAKTFEEGSGQKIASILPFDPKTAIGAEAAGKCVLSAAARSKLGRPLAAVAVMIAGVEQEPAKKGLMGLLRKKSKKQTEDGDD